MERQAMTRAPLRAQRPMDFAVSYTIAMTSAAA